MKSRKNRKVTKPETDIIELILHDHLPLKKLVKVLHDLSIKNSEKKASFEKFATLLLAHAKPEEQSLYSRLQEAKKADLRIEGFEGLTEHGIAENLIEEIRQTENKNEWTGKVKVLAEIVDHHLREEEGEMFKLVKKEFNLETRLEIGADYLFFKDEYEKNKQSVGKRKSQRKQPEFVESML